MMSAAALFATWFGAETVLGASSAFASDGLMGVMEDPFGASLCLFLIGIFFARKLYRLDILTFGDFYRLKYGKWVELVASICLILSYLGWIAAQMVATGLVIHLVSGIDMQIGIVIGSLVVILYTFFGGMWSVAVTDSVQMVLIIVGLLAALFQLNQWQSVEKIVSQTPKDYFQFLPENKPTDLLNYFASWITIGLGSIAQQDVFQRIMSSKTEKTAVRASYIGGILYLTIALIPLILALYASVLLPGFLDGDTQLMLPHLIMQHTSLWVQILFFGALLSAIMSTASGALLAPSAILGENIISHFLIQDQPKKLLLFSRIGVLIVAVISLGMALSNSNIYELVGESSALSLVSLFVPMVAGIYWKHANRTGALLSIFGGMLIWVFCLYLETEINPIIYGLGASILGMLIGGFAFRKNT
ncbi:MAG: sodium:solute symporter [Sphingobacteriales bacterium]|nr:MAG: sodium:solute symporter [Sphingobacteriales bacterium]